MSATSENTSGPRQTGSKLADNWQTESEDKKKGAKKVAKSLSDYWRSKVFKPQKRRGGNVYVSQNYSARMSWNGRRHSIPLTGNKETSAAKAAEIYRFLQRRGWEATLKKYATHLADEERPKQSRPITIGEFIREAETVSQANPRTFREYCQSLRRITAEALNMSPPDRGVVGRKEDGEGRVLAKGKKRELSPHDYRSAARRDFVAKIDALRLSSLTPALVNKWKVARVKKAGDNPIEKRQAMRTVSSMIRQAKSLFSPKGILSKLDLPAERSLPSPLPFEGVVPYSRKDTGRSRYVSTIDAGELLRTAQEELAESQPEAWKILVLALGAGLRRNEIDKLLWQQIDFDKGAILIAETPYFKPKSEDSAGEVELDDSLTAILRGYRPRATDDFVIESTRQLRNDSLTGRAYSFARAQEHFEVLYKWLRDHGIDSRKPLHALRKEAGSLVCQEKGIYAASRFLRHADIQVTAEHYLDKKERVTIGLGALLRPENVTQKSVAQSAGKKSA